MDFKNIGTTYSIHCLLKASFVLQREKTSELEILSQTAIETVVEDSNNHHLTEDGFLMVSLLKEKYFLAARPLFYQGVVKLIQIF